MKIQIVGGKIIGVWILSPDSQKKIVIFSFHFQILHTKWNEVILQEVFL